MAAWDWYPYDTYCELLSWRYVVAAPGPAANLSNDQSTLNVKFDEGAYNAYRKGGFSEAERFKDCVATRYWFKRATTAAPAGAPSREQYAAHLSLRLVRAVARAKQDEASEASLRAAAKQWVAAPGPALAPGPGETLARLFAAVPAIAPEHEIAPGGVVPMPMLPLAPAPAPGVPGPGEAYPTGGAAPPFLVEMRSWRGYSYRALRSELTDQMALEFSLLRFVGAAELDLGVTVPAKIIDWADPTSPTTEVRDWVLSEQALGRAVIMGVSLPDGVARIEGTQSGGAEGYLVSTRDISVAASLTQLDPRAMVLLEPPAGWMEPTALDMTMGREAGREPDLTVVYVVGGLAAVAVIAGLAYYAGRGR